MKTLEERVVALEKANRRWKRGAVAFAVALALAWFVAYRAVHNLCVEHIMVNNHLLEGGLFSPDELHIYNHQGNIKAIEIGSDDAGCGRIVVRNALGKQVVVMGASDGGGGMVEVLGGGMIQVYNPQGKPVAEMQCSKVNAGLVMANDVDGKIKQSLSGSR